MVFQGRCVKNNILICMWKMYYRTTLQYKIYKTYFIISSDAFKKFRELKLTAHYVWESNFVFISETGQLLVLNINIEKLNTETWDLYCLGYGFYCVTRHHGLSNSFFPSIYFTSGPQSTPYTLLPVSLSLTPSHPQSPLPSPFRKGHVSYEYQ